MASEQRHAPMQARSHETRVGAAAHDVKQGAYHLEDKAFKQQRAVDVSATQQPVEETETAFGAGPQIGGPRNELEVLCGPLLNYRHMSGEHTDDPIWHGSVLLVTKPGQTPGDLTVDYAGAVKEGSTLSKGLPSAHSQSFSGSRLYEDLDKSFWQFSINVPFLDDESGWFYSFQNMRQTSDDFET